MKRESLTTTAPLGARSGFTEEPEKGGAATNAQKKGESAPSPSASAASNSKSAGGENGAHVPEKRTTYLGGPPPVDRAGKACTPTKTTMDVPGGENRRLARACDDRGKKKKGALADKEGKPGVRTEGTLIEPSGRGSRRMERSKRERPLIREGLHWEEKKTRPSEGGGKGEESGLAKNRQSIGGEMRAGFYQENFGKGASGDKRRPFRSGRRALGEAARKKRKKKKKGQCGARPGKKIKLRPTIRRRRERMGLSREGEKKDRIEAKSQEGRACRRNL